MTPEGEVLRADRDAFAALYERHHRALYRYCRSIVGHEHDAQDAVQSTMTQAFAALRYDTREFDRRPWLFRIARNESISILRRRRATLALDPALARTDAVDERVEADERLRVLRQDLADLAERQRSALLLRELCGLGIAEIADEFGISPGAVKQAIFEARRELSKCGDGRSTPCLDVQRLLSDADGRVTRGRRVRAHLRSCAACRDFQAAIERRPADLAALAAPSAGVAALLAGQASGGAGALAGAVLTKIAIGAAVIVAVGAIPRASHAPRAAGSPVRRGAAMTPARATHHPAAGARRLHPSPSVPAEAPSRVPAGRRQAAAPPARRTRVPTGKTPASAPARSGSNTKQIRETGAANVTVPAQKDQAATAPGQAKKLGSGSATAPGRTRNTRTARGQAKQTAHGQAATPGQAKQTDHGQVTAPGQAKQTDRGQVTAPGQAKQTDPAPPTDGSAAPPGQVNRGDQGNPAPPGQDGMARRGNSGH